MEKLIEQQEYFYHCEITEEHLIDGRQEGAMEANNREEREWYLNPHFGPDDEEPEGWNTLRWYSHGKLSFADKDFDNFIKRIKREIRLKTKGKFIIQHEGNEAYILHENCHWLIKEVVLTRLHLYIYRHAIIEQKDGFVETLLQEIGA